MATKKSEKKKKEKKKKAKKPKGDATNAYAAFMANISAQKEQEHKTVDLDAFLTDTDVKGNDNALGKHARTDTQTILATLAASLADEDDDMKSPLIDDEDAVEHDDNADMAFLHGLNAYLGNDFVTHKRSWSNISDSSSRPQSGHSHGRSGTLFSLSHSRTRNQSIQLMVNTAKIEKKERSGQYKLFAVILHDKIDKLERFLERTIDLQIVWSFLDIILFRMVKYYKAKDDNIDTKDIYFGLFKFLEQKKFLKNGCFRQYIKFLTSSNAGNPISLLMDNLLLFENDKSENYNSKTDKLILAWQYIANKGYKNVDEIDVNSKDFDFFDPIRCDFAARNCFIKKVVIRKVFNSANKPLLLEIFCADGSESQLVLKKGDDLRKDKALMNIFKFMNYIWLRENKKKDSKFKLNYKKTLVKILTFNVVSITHKTGIIELVSNCIPLRHINRYLDELIDEHVTNLLSSAAASYIGSFICGVKDRHFDNILVRTTDACLFHIDFGYCLGESIKNPFAIDTSIFAITEDFYQIIGKDNYEKYFVPLCVDSFLCLRKYFKELIDFTMLSFSYLFKEKQSKKIEEFLMKKLKVYEKNEEKIREWLANKIKKAPFSKKTKLKNKLHRMNAPTLTEQDLENKVET